MHVYASNFIFKKNNPKAIILSPCKFLVTSFCCSLHKAQEKIQHWADEND